MKRLFLASVMTVLAGCSAASEKPAEGSTSAADVAAETASNEPATPAAPAVAVAPASGTPALSAYERKYPNEPVEGVTFVNHPAVRAIVARSGAPAAVSALMAESDQVVMPVRRAGRRLLASGYDPRGAGADGWSVLISEDGSRGAVCRRNAEGGSDWFTDGAKAFSLDGVCPSKPDDIEGLGDWPIGSIPG